MVIVYTSNSGFTQQYAEMLAKAEKMKCYELYDADKVLERGADILYMGPLMAGHIQGIDAAKKYNIRAACGVGLSPPGQQVLYTMSKANYLANAPIFYLHGGWDPKQMGPMQRRMVDMVTKNIRRELQAKGKNRTEWEERYLDMLLKGGSFVAYENLKTIREWLKEQAGTLV